MRALGQGSINLSGPALTHRWASRKTSDKLPQPLTIRDRNGWRASAVRFTPQVRVARGTHHPGLTTYGKHPKIWLLCYRQRPLTNYAHSAGKNYVRLVLTKNQLPKNPKGQKKQGSWKILMDILGVVSTGGFPLLISSFIPPWDQHSSAQGPSSRSISYFLWI